MLYNVSIILREVITIKTGRPQKDINDIQRFCDNFNRIIAEKNITQKQIAADLDLSPQAISLWANEKRMPSKKNMIRLAKILDVSVDELK